MNKLKRIWGHLRTSFWFVPSVIIALNIILASTLIQIDYTGGNHWLARWPRLFGVGAEGARSMLSMIAGSMMTVVGVTFSMTLMILVLASSQYTSRIVRNFMNDRVTQVVLGIFAGIFTYCLLVLRTIRSGDEGGFVPSLAVSFGVVLALGGISVLIFFIHHIASSIEASSIIASVARDTITAVHRLFPERLGRGPGDDAKDQIQLFLSKQKWQAVTAVRDGYIQSVDNELLLRLAREHETIVRMERGIGDFVVHNTTLASMSMENPPEEDMIAALREAYHIDRHRTVEQDPAFGIRQIVDMALRALSPSTNDTTTGIMCVDYLTGILTRLAGRNIPSPYRYEEGHLRVIAIGPTFAGLAAEAFDQIRVSAVGNLAIMLRILSGIETIAGMTHNAEHLRVLREQIQEIAELAQRSIQSPHDKTRFENRLERVRELLERASALTGAFKPEVQRVSSK